MLKRSKLLAPSPDSGIARPRLLRLLAGGQSICLLSAPAGFGKSMLAAHWLQQCMGARCWLSLDPADRTGTTLWETLIACLAQARPAFGSAARTLLQQSPLALDGLVESLVADLAAWRQDVPAGTLHLVLDDLHCLEDSPCLPALLELLRHLAGWARVVLTSRSLAFLAQQTVVAPTLIDVIDQHQLACDGADVEALAQQLGLSVPADVRGKLLARTDGWITPILLILRQMRNDGVTQRWNEAWLQGQSFTLTPLIRDHFHAQPESTRRLLTLLALAQPFDRSLLTSLSPLAGAAGDGLDAIGADTFIIRLQQPGWWKLHDLYRSWLLEGFAALPRSLQQQALDSVAEWLCRHGDHAKALALQAQQADATQLQTYLLRHYRHWLRLGLQDLLEQGVQLLTAAQVQASPQLCALFLWARADRLDLAECQAHVTRALAQVEEHGLPVDLVVELHSVLSYCELVKGDPASALQHARHALELTATAAQPLRSRALLTIGLLTYMQGDMSAASAALAQTLVCAQEERHYYHVILSLGYWMSALHLAGQFDEALAIYARTRQWLQAQEEAQPADLWLDVLPLDILIARSDLDAARQSLQPLLQLADHAAPSLRTALIYFRAVRFHYYHGDLHTSLEYLSRVEAAQEKLLLNWNWGWAPVAAWRRRIALRLHRRQELQQWYAAHPLLATDDIPFQEVEERLLDADVLAQIGDTDKAEKLAHRIARQAAAQSRRMHQLQALTVLSNVAHLRDARQPNPAAAEAEALAGALGAHCILRSEALWLKTGKAEQADAMPEPAAEKAASLADSGISRREQAVLVLLAQGKSNNEIAQMLHISSNTTKTHMKNILRKLNAKNRIEALLAARERGLL